MKTRPNLKNFIYLVVSGLIIQLAGAVYRIWMAREIGPEGLGIMQMVYPVYRLLSGLATLGLPLALIKWISEYLASHDQARILALKQWAVRMVFSTALGAGILLFFTAPFLAKLVFTDPRVNEALLIIAVAIPFSALSSIYRGYFQGFSRMAPTAISEITEQIAEISLTVILITTFNSRLVSQFAAPIVGLTVGEVVCFLTLLIYFHYKTSNATITTLPDIILPRPAIFRYAWPLLFNQIVSTISMASEGLIIPRLLISTGLTAAAGTGLFGQLTGMAEPISYFPLIFLSPLGTVLSPQVSSAFKNESFPQIKQKISIFYFTAVVLCLVSFGLIVSCADQLSVLFFNTPAPTKLIKLSAIGLPFTGIAILNISILAATGATNQILWFSIWGIGLKTFLLLVLTTLYGINGSAMAISINQIFICLVSWSEVRRILAQTGRKKPTVNPICPIPLGA